MILPAAPPTPTFMRGFTLTEMAVVLVIVALLIGGMVIPLSAQQDMRYVKETETTLKSIHEALVGFAAINDRLPCPATSTSNGVEGFAAGGDTANGDCAVFFDGFVPAVTLGIQPTDASGFAIDAWGRRIRYAVTDRTVNGSTRALTKTNGMRSATMSGIANMTLLSVCATATGIGTTDCGTAIKLSSSAPALVFSTGKNGPNADADEQANLATVDAVFVSHDPNPTFDDQFVWLSSNVLFNRMIAAGRLP